MFFEEDGIQVIQFGSGGIGIGPGLLTDGVTGSISLVKEDALRTIGERRIFAEIADTHFDIRTRLVFTDVRSIDVLIGQLKVTRSMMSRGHALRSPLRSIASLPFLLVGDYLLRLSEKIRE